MISGLTTTVSSRCGTALFSSALTLLLAFVISASPASAEERLYFSATDNVMDVLVQKINAEPDRIDVSIWLLTERTVTGALANRFRDGLDVRIIGDRGSIFEIDPYTRREFYWLASQGVPIRLRVNPTWYPEINHWKAVIFAGQNLVMFGSGNITPFELAPSSPTNYKDEIFLLTDDSGLVNSFKTQFDRIWNDTTPEPESLVGAAPYLKNWDDACLAESSCADYWTLYPSRVPMVINTDRLEPDYDLAPEVVWGQGPSFNNRIIQAIDAETTRVDFVAFRITVGNITNALLQKHSSGVPVRVIIEPQQYLNRRWPEFWLTHAFVDKLWAAGVPVKQRLHQGLTHMKLLVTSQVASIASSNFAAAWQRDHNYFLPAATKPALHQEIADRVNAMWEDTAAFSDFVPLPPDAPVLSAPVNDAIVPTTSALTWERAVFAVSYDVYLGTSSSSLSLVGNVPALLVNEPPPTYSWSPGAPLETGTRYFWKVVSRTNATVVNPAISASSGIRSFTTEGPPAPPPAPSSPTPSHNATEVGTFPTLGWASGGVGTTFDVAFGTVSPPSPVATGLTAASFQPGTLAPATTYFWQVTAVSGGSPTVGPIWSFTTGAAAPPPPTDVVLYASDATTLVGWTQTADPTAAGGLKLANPDAGVPVIDAPRAAPANYFEATFPAQAGVRYRVWLRIHPVGNSKWNDSVFVQFSDSVNASGAPIYRIGTGAGYIVNLWTCATCSTTGWGWQRNAYWLTDSGDVWFQNTGTHTIRVQNREDGAEIDQIVISPTTYATNAPGLVSNDTTIVPKPGNPLPGVPQSPTPAHGATAVSTAATLAWTASDAATYDVSFGTSNPPPTVATGTSSPSHTPSGMVPDTTYFWRIVARNSAGSTTGPVWSFTTQGTPPGAPDAPNPVDSAAGVATSATLTWSAAGATSYDVLFGTNIPLPTVASGLTTASFAPLGLADETTYLWQIVAHNAAGSTPGPIWTFVTAAPAPPAAPTSPSPATGSTDVARTVTLAWSGTGATLFDVYFGATNPPPLLATGLTAPSYAPAGLGDSTMYYWQVVAHNPSGSTPGAIWTFTTAAPAPPAAPTSPSPATGATDVAPNVTLTWSGPEASSFDLYFGAGSPPALLVAGLTTESHAVAGLSESTPYYWQVVAHGAAGSTPGPIWTFTTMAAPAPPGTPHSPGPADGATNVSPAVTLTWTGPGANSYDVRLGTSNPPGPYATGVATPSYSPGGLAESTVYFWQVIAHNGTGATPGPVWAFTTSAPPPPAIPATPSPSHGAIGVERNVTLTWTGTGASSYDVYLGASNPPPPLATALTSASYAPAGLAEGTLYFWQVVAHGPTGSTPGPIWSFTTLTSPPPPPSEIVIYASDVTPGNLHGSWATASDATSPGAVKLVTSDTGFARLDSPLATPVHYFEVTFEAQAGVPYRLWLRLQALGNSKWNDSLWVQFSDAASGTTPVYRIGTTSGLLVNLATNAAAGSLNQWGWHNGAYWLTQPTTLTFGTTGPQTLRVQVREDGVQLDQIVLSPTAFRTTPPGPVGGDQTIVPKPN